MEASVAAALRAVARFEEAGSYVEQKETARSTMCRALAKGDDGAVFQALGELLEKNPLHWRRLEILLGRMPEKPEGAEAQVLVRVLKALSAELAARGQYDSDAMRNR